MLTFNLFSVLISLRIWFAYADQLFASAILYVNKNPFKKNY